MPTPHATAYDARPGRRAAEGARARRRQDAQDALQTQGRPAEERDGAQVDLTLVVPCHNEQDNVELFFDTATKVFAEAGVSLELVFVNDGSSDATLERLRGIERQAREGGQAVVQVISFSRNFGKESGVYAGLRNARGACLCIIDADLQQDPAVALKMYEYLKGHPDCDEVAAYQAQRHESRMMKWFKERFYAVFNSMSKDIRLTPDASDFRVFTRQVAQALLSMPEYFRFSKGLFSWVGFNVHTMPYVAEERHSGTSNWSYRSLFSYAADGIMSFTTWPLKVVKYIGLAAAVVALAYLLYSVIVDYVVLHNTVAGYPTLVCLILLFGGVQMMALGIIGDYLARDYVEGKHRPIYLVKEHLDSMSGEQGGDVRGSSAGEGHGAGVSNAGEGSVGRAREAVQGLRGQASGARGAADGADERKGL